MKLEVIDKRNPVFIRVATVADTDDHRIKVSVLCCGFVLLFFLFKKIIFFKKTSWMKTLANNLICEALQLVKPWEYAN